MMKKNILILLLLWTALSLCAQSVIPSPESLLRTEGTFRMEEKKAWLEAQGFTFGQAF